MIENNYLTDIPQEYEEKGFAKVLLVRHEIIHLKHILTEIFVRKTIDIEKYLNYLEWSIFNYMEYITNRMRKIHHFNRSYKNNLNDIVKQERDRFFPTVELYKGLNNIIVLDFDGVVTSKSFRNLYELCITRENTVICTANPTVTNDWFIKNKLSIPKEIHACKGKKAKIKRLIELSKKHDYVFYIDNESEYLDYAWLFGIQTYKYENKKIIYYTLNTK